MQRLSMKKKRRRKKEGKKIGHDNLGSEKKNACEVSERERERERKDEKGSAYVDRLYMRKGACGYLKRYHVLQREENLRRNNIVLV